MKVYAQNGRIVAKAPEDVKETFDDNGPQAKSTTIIIIIKRILHIIVPRTMLSTVSASSHQVLIKCSDCRQRPHFTG